MTVDMRLYVYSNGAILQVQRAGGQAEYRLPNRRAERLRQNYTRRFGTASGKRLHEGCVRYQWRVTPLVTRIVNLVRASWPAGVEFPAHLYRAIARELWQMQNQGG